MELKITSKSNRLTQKKRISTLLSKIKFKLMKKTILIILFYLIIVPSFGQNDSISNAEKTQFILVRHAEKLDASKNPELSELGKKRAEKLNELLKDVAIDKLYATNYLRTQNTLRPISQRTDLKIETYDPNDINFSSNLISENEGKTVVISGHSNSTPKLVNQLIGKEVYKPLDENEYGKIWIITFLGNAFVSCIVLNY